MESNVVREKSKAFALRIVKLYKFLVEEKNEKVLSKQLLRSGISIGANVSESVYASSKNDFVNKLSIAQKEASETEYWLDLLTSAEFISAAQYQSIISDCQELLKLLASIIIASKKK